MRQLSIFIFVVLAAISMLHIYWGMGGLWPGATTKELIDTVIGVPEMQQMPPAWMTLVIAALIFLGGVFALAASGFLSFGPRWLVRMAVGALALVFIGRAAAGFWIAHQGSKASEPFATNDLLFYSPLCLAIGAGFAALLFFMKPTGTTR